MVQESDIIGALASIIHPEYKEDIVSLGMVDKIDIFEDKIRLSILSKKVKDPFESSIRKIIVMTLEEKYPQFKGMVTLFIKEPANKPQIKKSVPSAAKESKTIKNIIAIASGKGGVGKSTVTANIAVQLAKSGYSVGVIDADIYGPSQPKMFGCEDYVPSASGEEGKELIAPAQNYGVKVMSIGFFIKASDALVWRGPMATNALKQLVHQTDWGPLDFLLIDLPPGTGDVHLTMLSELKFNGAIIVGTPQEVALADVVRGISMFTSPNINIPILGVIENMAWFTPAELPENRYYIFGKEGVKNLAEKEGYKLLAQIPLVQGVCEGADNGVPASLNSDLIGDIYKQLISNLI